MENEISNKLSTSVIFVYAFKLRLKMKNEIKKKYEMKMNESGHKY